MPRVIAAYALAIGGSVQGGIVHQKHHLIGTEFGIAFKHSVAILSTFAKGRQGIFRGQSTRAAVRNPAGIGPSLCAEF
jgi:hypothetical protein